MSLVTERGVDPMSRSGEPIIRVENLTVEFSAGRGQVVHAVSDVTFEIRDGETVGVVGESGCGKSTTGRAIMQLPPPTSGKVWLEGEELTGLEPEKLRQTRTRLQMIFQDPISSLNPRRRVRDIVAEAFSIWGEPATGTVKERVDEVLDAVGLDPDVVRDRRPHEFSGGQCQRICIARALVLNPRVLICDEPVSALDVSVQAQILNLLEDMKARYRLSLLFISHDLAVVKNISDRVIVMYAGKIVESATSDILYDRPLHPYTKVLLASVPEAIGSNNDAVLTGEPPSALEPPSGCRFRLRCPKAASICSEIEPLLTPVTSEQAVACHFPG